MCATVVGMLLGFARVPGTERFVIAESNPYSLTLSMLATLTLASHLRRPF